MFDCTSHFRLADTPHIASIEVTNGGTGYTWAKAKVVGGSGRGVRLRCVIVAGVITEIIVTHPGRGFTSQPTIEIIGDGSGATAEPMIAGGGIVYENTTQVQDWRGKECDDYNCKFDNADPPNELPPEERPGECLITPEPIPIQTIDSDECEAGEFSPPILENTYALKDPPEYLDYSVCVKRGFKVAFAKKAWHGRFGFVDSASPSQQKFLTFTASLSFTYQNDIVRTDGNDDTHETITAIGQVQKTINRYTGRQQTTIDSYAYTYNGAPETEGSFYAQMEAMRRTDGLDSKAIFAATVGPDLELFGLTPLTAAEIIAAINAWTIDESSGGNIDTTTATPGTVSISNSQIKIEYTLAKHAESADGTVVQDATHTFSLVLDLTNGYTPGDVFSDGKVLLAQVDLCNDAQIPWRFDVPIHQASPAGHYVKQEGPAFGPLVSWAEDADGNPVMRGVPNPAGYEPFFDSLHINKEYGECDGALAGNYAWLEQTKGAWCPAKYGTATQWSDDLTENMFLPGSNASFNSPPREYQICGTFTQVHDGELYLSKWAEIYIFEFQHHNSARPCGPEDQATRDPDTIDCDEESPGYNPTGDLRWPTAPAECVGGSIRRQGSYSVKRWDYRGTELQSMSCASGNISGPCRTAIFIQDEEPSGAYEGSLRIAPASISFFDERYDGQPKGDWSLVQFHQAMVDPLWKQPKICEDGVKVNDPDAVVPYEENTDCADVDCNATPDDPRCLPGTPLPWAWAEQDI